MAQGGRVGNGVRQLLAAAALASAATEALSDDQRLYRSPYYLGRGDAGIATADNQEAIFYNPAGLAWGKGIYKETIIGSPMVELSSSTKDLIRQVAIEKDTEVDSLRGFIGKNQHLGIQNFSGVVFRRAALGGLVSSHTDLLIHKSADDGGLEVVKAEAVANQVATFSVAESFFDQFLLLGATGKYVNRQRAAIDLSLVDAQDATKDLKSEDVAGTASGGGADLGMMLRGGGKTPMSMGVTIENAGKTTMASSTAQKSVPDLKQTVNVGFAIEPGTKVSRIGLYVDFRDVTGAVEKNPLKRIHFGAEMKLKQFIGFMGGFNQGYPTFGVFVNAYVMRLDVGGYTEEMGERIGDRPDPRGYFRLSVGF